MKILISLVAVLVGTVSLAYAADDRLASPNIVVILIDDLGYGDLGCYGSTENSTPQIDRLAAGGIRCTDFHSNGPMCSPTRAALLTGCYQQRFGPEFDTALGPNEDRSNGLPLAAITVAEVLEQQGYATGMFGKWHLGYKPPLLPPSQGFQTFVGLATGDGDHHTHVGRRGEADWWRGNRLKMEEGYTTDLLTRHGTQFIEEHAEQPFLLYLSHLAIHFPWQGPDDPPHRQLGVDYTDDKWGVIPDRKNVAPHVSAMISAVDESTGRILEALQRGGVAENTLVCFLSDNGGYLDYGGGTFENISSNGPLRGQKTEVYEGGHRVPAIFSWPGRIDPGQVSDATMMTMDLFPTLLRLAGSNPPAEQALDGVDLGPMLLHGESLQPRDLFWRADEEHAVRRGRWKLIRGVHPDPELYDLETDLGEQNNVAAKHQQLVRDLIDAYNRWEAEVELGFQHGG